METKEKLNLEEQLLDRIRFFNRRYFNPFSLCFAGRPKSFWSVILHCGRKSGKGYITPIVTVRRDGSFIIPLPYGKQVDWFKNIMAAGGCDLIYQGKVYRASKAELVPFEDEADVFAGWVQRRLRRLETDSVLRLNQVCEAPDGESLYRSFTSAYPLTRGIWILAIIGFILVEIGRLFRRR
ncbi:MAG: hypothetical protein EHM41_09355 [Chloroflexi bacterium]|nr:MAG: hypothetical protein EHM41_09355 [Chloroflexota bacterium]